MKKTTLLTLTMRVLMMFPMFTLLAFIPYVNILISIVSLALIGILLIKKGIARESFFLLVTAFGSTALNVYITGEKIIHINEVIYLGYMCAFFVLIIDNRQEIKEYFLNDARYIRTICILWSVLVLISMPFEASYEDGAFISFAGDTFRLSPSALFIMSLSTMLIVTQGRRNIIYSVLPLLAILMGTSRTYLLLGGLCLAINIYFVITNRRYYLLFLSVLLLICAAIVLSSSMGDKIESSFEEIDYLTPLQVFTSGRSNFWVRDLVAYGEQPLFNKLLGCGFNFVRNVNGAFVGLGAVGFWAHNDFIQALITNGIFGLCIYLYAIRRMFRAYMDRKLPKSLKASLVFIWLFNAFFNMYYVYICAMVSLPVLLLACEFGYNKIYDRKKRSISKLDIRTWRGRE